MSPVFDILLVRFRSVRPAGSEWRSGADRPAGPAGPRCRPAGHLLALLQRRQAGSAQSAERRDETLSDPPALRQRAETDRTEANDDHYE